MSIEVYKPKRGRKPGTKLTAQARALIGAKVKEAWRLRKLDKAQEEKNLAIEQEHKDHQK